MLLPTELILQIAEATGFEPAWRYYLPPVFRTGALPIRLNFHKAEREGFEPSIAFIAITA